MTGITSSGTCAGTRGGRKYQRLLRAPGRGHAGNEGAEQQLLGRVRQQRRHGSKHGDEERNRPLPWQCWYFLQRSQLNARDFFNPEYVLGNPLPNPKPDSRRDQGGFSLGGPIVKNRTFFFVDFEKVASSSSSSGVVTVPTLAERQGDFSGAANPIYDPTAQGCGNPCVNRPQVQYNGQPNVIPPSELDPIGLAVLNLYPKPSNANEFNNYNFTTLAQAPDYQFDIKIDHQINDRNRISGRYSRGWSSYTTPLTLGDGFDNDGIKSGVTVAQNASLEYAWTINPRIIWTSHVGVDRVHELSLPGIPTISSFNASLPAGVQGLPSVFQTANGIDKMPTFLMQGSSPWSNLYDQCCINTTFAHTLVSYSSQLVISKGAHLIKVGGEQRIFYNDFWQPNY